MRTTERTEDIDQLANRAGDLLRESASSVAVAESLTGGMVVSALARVEGSPAEVCEAATVTALELLIDALDRTDTS